MDALLNAVSNDGAVVFLPASTCGEEDIHTVVHSHHKAVQGCIMACVVGTNVDGHDFAPQAIQNGASMLCCSRRLPLDVPQIVVSDVRHYMGRLASIIYSNPSSKMRMLAVTGTNGKTTSTYMIRSILQQSGIKTGLMGTIVYDDGNSTEYADHTTPENTDVQRYLSRMEENGCEACVMEASSHGLKQGRLAGCSFDGAAITNLTPEHLDYHITMEDYFNSKLILFRDYMKQEWRGVSNADDRYGQDILRRYPAMMSYGFSGSAQLTAALKDVSLSGMVLDFKFTDGTEINGVKLPMLGTYNGMNAMLAVALTYSMGADRDMIKIGLEAMPQVPGRLERYTFSNGVSCIIDFAHTPDGLRKVLSAVKPHCRGRLWSVFGFGGNRCAENRPVMGHVASEFADRIVVTMDNPRNENPSDIASQIVSGFPENYDRYDVIINRGDAIRHSLSSSQPEDIVVISGKGPERFIIYADRLEPFEDKEIVMSWGREAGVI